MYININPNIYINIYAKIRINLKTRITLHVVSKKEMIKCKISDDNMRSK